MPFGLCNVPITFFKMITKTFKYLDQFMEVFLDDLIFYNNKEYHFNQLQKCLEKCYVNFTLILILKKCAFFVNLGVLLGHIRCVMEDF